MEANNELKGIRLVDEEEAPIPQWQSIVDGMTLNQVASEPVTDEEIRELCAELNGMYSEPGSAFEKQDIKRVKAFLNQFTLYRKA